MESLGAIQELSKVTVSIEIIENISLLNSYFILKIYFHHCKILPFTLVITSCRKF